MKMDDDFLNRYIDGELGKEEIEELEKALASSTELNKRLQQLKMADMMFKSMKAPETSPDFTSMMMQKIQKNKKSFQRTQFWFFSFILGLLALLVVSFAGYFLVQVFAVVSEKPESPEVSGGINSFVNLVKYYSQELFSGPDFSLIGSLAAVTLLISGYFFYENLREYKSITK